MFVVAVVGKAWANPETTISIAPATVNDSPSGETFTVDVVIADVTSLLGWQMNVTFNPSILNAEKVSEGPFLVNVNGTVWPKPVIDNTRGYLFASASLMPPYPLVGITGSGILANITFTVKSGGSSALHFDDTTTYLRILQSGVSVPIEVVKQDGTYGSGGGGGVGGIPLELIAVVVAVVVVVVGAGVIFMRRRA